MPQLLTDQKLLTPARLLIVDDDPNIRTFLRLSLNSNNYSLEEARSGHEAVKLLGHNVYDLMVLDLSMPDLDGVQVMTEARQLHPELSIIILTAYPTTNSAISALKMEVTDYLCKPVTAQEIISTVARSLCTRAKRLREEHLVQVVQEALGLLDVVEDLPNSKPKIEANPKQILYVEPLELDYEKLQVTVYDQPIRTTQLTVREAAVLKGLMLQSGQVISCPELASEALGHATISNVEAETIIRPCICRLRQKIEMNTRRPRYIHTVRNRGYIFQSKRIKGQSQRLLSP